MFPMNRKQALVRNLGYFKGLIIKLLRKVKTFYMSFGVLIFVRSMMTRPLKLIKLLELALESWETRKIVSPISIFNFFPL